jgi:hypothetical protein
MLMIAVVGAVGKSFVAWKLEKRADTEVPKIVAQQQAMLPVKLNDNVELTGVSYDNRTLHYEATSEVWMDSAEVDAQSLRQNLITAYCQKMKVLVNANVSVEYEIKVPPKTLNDRATRFSFVIHPADCG